MPNTPTTDTRASTAIRTVLAFVGAALVSYALAAIAATQGALASLPTIAQPIPIGVRLATTSSDLLGMLPLYAPLIAASLFAGFLVARFVLRWLPDLRSLAYLLAGALALLALHLIMRNTFDGIIPVAATRSTSGLLLQMLAGAAGGWLFARLTRAPQMTRTAQG